MCGMAGKTKRDKAQLEEGLVAGKSLAQAMRDAGFPESRARNGVAGLPKAWQGPADRMLSLIEKGKQYTADQRAAIVRGALLDAVEQGKDVVSAATQIGKDREVSMWVSEQSMPVVIIQPPQGFLEEFERERKGSSITDGSAHVSVHDKPITLEGEK